LGRLRDLVNRLMRGPRDAINGWPRIVSGSARKVVDGLVRLACGALYCIVVTGKFHCVLLNQ
jgi:hypothetical protein